MTGAVDFVKNTGEGAKPWCVFASDGVKKLGAFATEPEAKLRLDELAAINVEAAPVLRTDSSELVHRFDVGGRLGRLERTPSGGVRVDARLTRTGIFEYERADGTVVRELRHPDEVFAEKSLASLLDAPVTIGHPDRGRMVSPATFRADSVGHVREKGRVDESRYVASSLAIQDADAIKRCESADFGEISSGYACKIDGRPGLYQGQPYDVAQREIQYNHVALLPRGTGRAGADVALRLDSHAAFQRGDAEEEPMSDQHVQQLKTIGMLEAQVKDLTAARDREQARADAAAKKVVELAKDLADERDPKRLDERVITRSAFLGRARKILGAESKFDGKTDDEIMREALKKAAPELDLKDRSGDYVRARFDAEVDRAGTSTETPLAAARRDALGAPATPRHDGDADDYVPPPMLANAWKPRADAKS